MAIDRVTLPYIKKMCGFAGLQVHVYRPGDGKIRYRFWPVEQPGIDGYFCDEDLFQTANPQEASGFISGYMCGKNRETQRQIKMAIIK